MKEQDERAWGVYRREAEDGSWQLVGITTHLTSARIVVGDFQRAADESRPPQLRLLAVAAGEPFPPNLRDEDERDGATGAADGSLAPPQMACAAGAAR